MNIIIPEKLSPNDEVRIIAPSQSLGIIAKSVQSYAVRNFQELLGLRVSYGKNASRTYAFNLAGIKNRLEDLHAAFADPKVKAIFTAIGGFNSNELLDYMDWSLIAANPKIFCGFSDITALQNAMLAKTGLVSYSGPHFSTLGQKYLDAYTIKYLKECLFSAEPIKIDSSKAWTDDRWFEDQEKRQKHENMGFWDIGRGEGTGMIVGGNLTTLNALQGTTFMLKTDKKVVLFIEDDDQTDLKIFRRDLVSLLQSDSFSNISAVVVGRFQVASEVDRAELTEGLLGIEKIRNKPVVANVDFGHTEPKITFPVGGKVKVSCGSAGCNIEITDH